MTIKKLLRELKYIAEVEGIEATYGDIRDVTIFPSRAKVSDDADAVVILTASLSRNWR